MWVQGKRFAEIPCRESIHSSVGFRGWCSELEGGYKIDELCGQGLGVGFSSVSNRSYVAPVTLHSNPLGGWGLGRRDRIDGVANEVKLVMNHAVSTCNVEYIQNHYDACFVNNTSNICTSIS